MSGKSPEHELSLSLDALRRIDGVCRRFESAWKAGQRPRIEQFLGDAEEPERSAILQELLLLDLEYCARSGTLPPREQYLSRFPGHAALIEEAFRTSTPAKKTKPVSLQEFIGRLVRSGLFSAAELSAFQDSLPPEKRPNDVQSLARQLVRAGKLTKYQAEMVYRGKTKGLVLDDYVVLEEIGAGGMGQVFKAWHRTMDRVVALKKLSPAVMQSSQAVERFRREVKAAARLMHPNIVTALHAGEHEGIHYLVMEYVDGPDLADVLAARGPLPVATAIDYVIQAARGLQRAHKQGIVHRDVKPGNLLLDRDGTVKVLDMGLALVHQPEKPLKSAAEESLTEGGQVMGTYDYMAPEQAEDAHHADHRADVYSLGCTLYRLLTGQRPYQGDTAIRTVIAHRERPIPALRASRADVSADLDAVCRKMMAKRPEDRQQTMAEVIADLQKCPELIRPSAEHPPVPPPPPHPPEAPPVAEGESSADSKLREFLRDLGQERAPARGDVSRGVEDTAGPQGEQQTRMPGGRRVIAARRRRQTLTLASLVVAAAAVLVMLAVIPNCQPEAVEVDLEVTDRVDGKEPEETSEPSGPKTGEPDKTPEPEAPEWESALAEAEAQSEALVQEQRFGEAIDLYNKLGRRFEHVQFNRLVADQIDAVEKQAATTYRHIEKSARQLLAEHQFDEARDALRVVIEKHGIPANTEAAQQLLAEIDAAEARWERPKKIERQQQGEQIYAEAMKPIEEKVGAWDFEGALVALRSVRLEGEEFTARLTAWRDGITRLMDLKRRIIEKINSADPPIRTKDLMIPGQIGVLVKADETGVTARLRGDKTESRPWPGVGPETVEALIRLETTAAQPSDWLAAGILALASNDPTSAKEHFEQAASLRAEIAPLVAHLAATAFVEALQLLEAQKFKEAGDLLEKIEADYGDTPWFASNAAAFEAARQRAQSKIDKEEAEKLYADAVRLYEAGRLFKLKSLVESLENDYRDSQPVTDQPGKPSFADFKRAVADLGQYFAVRQDGKGNFTRIQEAINGVSQPNSLVEICDEGPYREKIEIPETKRGLTLRGKEDCWPVITSDGVEDAKILVSVDASHVTLERLVLLHVNPAETPFHCLQNRKDNFRVSSTLMYTKPESNHPRHAFSTIHTPTAVEGCLILGWTELYGPASFEDCLLLGHKVHVERGAEFRYCTIIAELFLGEKASATIADSILARCSLTDSTVPLRVTNSVLLDPFSLKGMSGWLRDDPRFRKSSPLDCQLSESSPYVDKASDKGHLGCRYTSEMNEMCKKAVGLPPVGMPNF